jgi:molybdate transport system substrate-binding protein
MIGGFTPIVILCVPMVLAACSSGAAPASDEGSSGLVVFAAASLTAVFEELAPHATLSFAGSDELATQIREGAPADLYASADTHDPAELHAEGLVDEPVVFATNRLVVVVPADNPANISSWTDLRTDGVRLVLGDEGVPVGDYARAALEKLGAPEVLDNVVSFEQDVKGVVGKVSLGEADAGIVYATDVAPAGGTVAVVEIPQSAQPAIEYAVAIASASPRQAAARELIEILLGERGRAALREAGFGVP